MTCRTSARRPRKASTIRISPRSWPADVSDNSVDRGVLICGTGIGMAITANKFPGVRAAACVDEVTAELSRRHNDLNVLCLSGDLISSRVTERLVQIWMATEFEGGRHQRRVDKISKYESRSAPADRFRVPLGGPVPSPAGRGLG